MDCKVKWERNEAIKVVKENIGKYLCDLGVMVF